MPDVITNNLDLWTSALLAKSTAGRGNNGRLEAYGIKKLRELILELAVRGKLVPQDSSDEPASGLLGRIEKEKAQLVKEGKIRKESILPKISEEDKPYQIPESWEWARLTDLYYSISPSGSKIKSSEFLDEGKYPVVDQGKSYIAGYTNESELLIEIPGPVVIFGDHTTEIKYVDFDFVAGADGTKILRPYRMDERYFFTYLKNYKLENRGYARHFKVLNDNIMALPPLAEQHRIVAKVDELMALCDQLEQQQSSNLEAHQTLVEILLGTLTNVESQQELTEAWTRIANHFDTLFTTEQSIDKLKQTILQLAVMGILVPQDPNDESGKTLLAKINSERLAAVKARRICPMKQSLPVGAEELAYDIRPGWALARLIELVMEITTGPFGSSLHKSDYQLGGTPVINPASMTNGKIVPIDKMAIGPAILKRLEVFKLKEGDIVMARRGEMGRCAIVTKKEDGWLCGTGSLVFRMPTSIYAPFVALLIGAPKTRDYLGGESVGATMQNLNQAILAKMPVGVPPVAEQICIVAKVDELMALCDTLKARLTDTQTTQIHLADAIVEQAVA